MQTDPSFRSGDYERVARAIGFIAARVRRQPRLADVAREMGLSPSHAQRVFSRWAGVSPKDFLSYLTHAHARALLEGEASVLDAAYATGLSGPGRLHDLTLKIEALSPGEIKREGEGVTLCYGTADSPFGPAVLVVTGRGLAGLAFADRGGEEAALADLARRWPKATLRRDVGTVSPLAARIFDRGSGPLRLLVAGTPFQIQVWEALLRIPAGRAMSYGRLAAAIGAPRAVRAVASAVGRNPIAYLIPCHRVLRESGALGGYRWGLTRKRAMLAFEAARRTLDDDTHAAQ